MAVRRMPPSSHNLTRRLLGPFEPCALTDPLTSREAALPSTTIDAIYAEAGTEDTTSCHRGKDSGLVAGDTLPRPKYHRLVCPAPADLDICPSEASTQHPMLIVKLDPSFARLV